MGSVKLAGPDFRYTKNFAGPGFGFSLHKDCRAAGSRIVSTQTFRAAGGRDFLYPTVSARERDVQGDIRKDQRSHISVRFFVSLCRFGSALVVVVRTRMSLSKELRHVRPGVANCTQRSICKVQCLSKASLISGYLSGSKDYRSRASGLAARFKKKLS